MTNLFGYEIEREELKDIAEWIGNNKEMEARLYKDGTILATPENSWGRDEEVIIARIPLKDSYWGGTLMENEIDMDNITDDDLEKITDMLEEEYNWIEE